MNLKSLLGFIFILTLAGIYIPNMPSTVQMGDTGELVRSAFFLQLAHPPGYPLFTWLFHFAIKLLHFGSVFGRASFFNVLISFGVCYLLFNFLRRNVWVGFTLALTLATSKIYWRYTELPDVFILNAFFTAGLLVLYFDDQLKKMQSYIPFLFILGLAHHLTLIFLLPVAFHVFIKNIKSRQQWLQNIGALVLVIFLYCSMMLLSPDSFMSWGQVDNLKSVLHHFLRFDYGTFKLTGSDGSNHLFQIVEQLFKQAIYSFLPLILIGPMAFIYRLKKLKNVNLKDYILMAIIILYIVIFFLLSNINPYGFWEETISRFYIFFNILFFFWTAVQIINCNLSNRLMQSLAGLLFLTGALNIYQFHSVNNFSKNTIIEDYALNFLNQAPSFGKPIILLTMSDTRFYAVQYAQTVLDRRPDIIAVHPNLLFFPWYWPKIKQQGIRIKQGQIQLTNALEIENDFLIPNLAEFTFITNLKLVNAIKYKITFAPTANILELGSGINKSIESEGNFRSDFKILKSDTSQYDIFREVWSDYSAFYLNSAKLSYLQKDFAAVKQQLDQGLQQIPWSRDIKSNLCRLEKELNQDSAKCEDELKKTEEQYFHYL